MKTPRLADVHCTPVRFLPGDRVIVRLKQRLDKEAIKKLKKTVQKWAGDHVEILVVDLTVCDLEIEQKRGLVV